MKTNHKASISLIIMFTGFLLTLFSDKITILFSNNKTVLMIFVSGFEAGLVGGIADWFAVTALFRHPLGIPISHTALLPKNRERITTALVSIVENNLLNKASIINKVHELNIVRIFFNICKNGIYSNEVRSKIIYIIKSGIDHISINKISIYFINLIQEQLNKLDSKDFLEACIDMFLKNNYEQKILDDLIEKGEELVRTEEIKNKFKNIIVSSTKNLKLNGIKQYTLNAIISLIGKEKIGDIVQDLIISALNDLKNKESSNRIMILEVIQNNIRSISGNEIIMENINKFKSDLHNNIQLNDFLVEKLNELKSAILIHINDDIYIERNIVPFVNNLIDKILSNIELIDNLEQYIQEQAVEYINNNHEKIGKLVKENIEKIDTETLIELIEYKVGDDLQWIRVNGAICGFFIGLILGVVRVIFI
jgi:uncharacterized membrane-anchored protein YjiN (DUF445 family)